MIAVAEANCEVLVDGGTFAPEGGVERVRFRSGELVTNRASSLFELIIDGAPSLTVGSNTPKLIAKVTGANAESSLKLNPDSDRSSSDPTLVVGEIRDLKVVLSARHLTLEVIKEARNLVIHGPGTIALGAGAAGDNVLITKSWPRLWGRSLVVQPVREPAPLYLSRCPIGGWPGWVPHPR